LGDYSHVRYNTGAVIIIIIIIIIKFKKPKIVRGLRHVLDYNCGSFRGIIRDKH